MSDLKVYTNLKHPSEIQPWRFQPIDKQSAVPAYLQITTAIKEVLRGGVHAPGSALPPERVLCEQFGVSRMTMREANDLLEREGYIERHVRRGTFVALQRILKRQQEMRSFSEELLARGARPSSTLLTFRTVHLDSASAEFFGLPQTEWVYEIQRVRLGDGTPIALETVQIPCFLCKGLEHFNLKDHSLYRILEEHYGLQLAYCVEEISPRARTGYRSGSSACPLRPPCWSCEEELTPRTTPPLSSVSPSTTETCTRQACV